MLWCRRHLLLTFFPLLTGTPSNKSHAIADHQRIAKLDRENEVAPPPKVDHQVAQAISQARQTLGLTQKELAQRINEKPQVVSFVLFLCGEEEKRGYRKGEKVEAGDKRGGGRMGE